MSNVNFGYSAAAYGIIAALLSTQFVPNAFYYTPQTGSADPRRTPGSRAHKRWKRARASGRH